MVNWKKGQPVVLRLLLKMIISIVCVVIPSVVHAKKNKSAQPLQIKYEQLQKQVHSEKNNVRMSGAITYDFDGSGRLGDKLVLYCKAKWLAYRYGIPFVYKEFDGADQFIFHYIEKKNNPCISQWKEIIRLNDEKEVNAAKELLYSITILTKISEENIEQKTAYEFWHEMKKMLACCVSLDQSQIIVPPKNMISVAVHVRKGGGFDPPLFYETAADGLVPKDHEVYVDKQFPLKFPPDSFYLEQIEKIASLHPSEHIHVHIFTDDKNPIILQKKYLSMLNNQRITIGCRGDKNAYDQNVLEDLFSMANFDYLIRPNSNFSLIAQILGNHCLVITPKSFKDEGYKRIITETKTFQCFNPAILNDVY